MRFLPLITLYVECDVRSQVVSTFPLQFATVEKSHTEKRWTIKSLFLDYRMHVKYFDMLTLPKEPFTT